MKEDREKRGAWLEQAGLLGGPEGIPDVQTGQELEAELRLTWNPRAKQPAFRLPMALAIPGWLMAILIAILAIVVGQVTPKLRERLVEFLVAFYQEAKASENRWDDYLALFLLIIFGVPIPETK